MERYHQRFHIVSGKGGVGKTTYAAALTLRLNSQGRKARYIQLQQSALGDKQLYYQEQETLFAENQKLFIPVNLDDTVCEYIQKKIKSRSLAKIIVGTSFFQAIFNMLPSLGHLIYLGKLLEMLNEDPELIIVLDAPSSGHLVTLFESIKNFSEIFESGIIFDDTLKMLNTLYSPGYHLFHLITLPSEMALTECCELRDQLNQLDARTQIQIVLNNSLQKFQSFTHESLPIHFAKKIELEKKLTKKYESMIALTVNNVLFDNNQQLIKDVEAQL